MTAPYSSSKPNDNRVPFPKEAPILDIGPLPFTLMHDFAKYTNGTMAMRFVDTSATFTMEDGTKGEVGATVGGCFYLSLGDRAWQCRPQQIVDALLAALEKEKAGEQTPAKKRRGRKP